MVVKYLRYLLIGTALTPVAAFIALLTMTPFGMPVLFLKGYWLLALKLAAPGAIIVMPLARLFFELRTQEHNMTKRLSVAGIVVGALIPAILMTYLIESNPTHRAILEPWATNWNPSILIGYLLVIPGMVSGWLTALIYSQVTKRNQSATRAV
jgi:hypothetical protein